MSSLALFIRDSNYEEVALDPSNFVVGARIPSDSPSSSSYFFDYRSFKNYVEIREVEGCVEFLIDFKFKLIGEAPSSCSLISLFYGATKPQVSILEIGQVSSLLLNTSSSSAAYIRISLSLNILTQQRKVFFEKSLTVRDSISNINPDFRGIHIGQLLDSPFSLKDLKFYRNLDSILKLKKI